MKLHPLDMASQYLFIPSLSSPIMTLPAQRFLQQQDSHKHHTSLTTGLQPSSILSLLLLTQH